jgi:hypothetical protein
MLGTTYCAAGLAMMCSSAAMAMMSLSDREVPTASTVALVWIG